MTIATVISKRAAACGLALAMGAMAPAIQAQTTVPTYPVVPPMMGGYGPGWGAHGMGPGWGGAGIGPMMGGPGMGSMMGGMGMGPMMGGPGTGRMMGGPGMMGPQWQNVLDLTAEQREALTKLHEETRKAHWAIMGELLTQQARLRDLVMAPTLDGDALAGTAKTINELRQRMRDSAAEAHKNMRSVLTPEQLEKLQNLWGRTPVPVD